MIAHRCIYARFQPTFGKGLWAIFALICLFGRASAQPANFVGLLNPEPHSVTLRPTNQPLYAWSTSQRTLDSSRPRVGLVLSGGGTRGFSQIGVLKVLERLHLRIDAIVGTSIGSLVGGLYCAGYSADELDSIVRATDWNSLVGYGDETDRADLFIDQKLERDRSLLTLRLDGFSPMLPEAVSTGARLTQYIEQLVWASPYRVDGSFDRLRCRFRSVTTDLASGSTVVLDSGNLALAMRASATIPLRFEPVTIDSLILVDGGLLANVPVSVARRLGCDIVIVVNSTSPLQSAENLRSPWNVADQVVTLMMRRLSSEELADADLVISPNLDPFSGSDFSMVGSIIDSGEAAAERAQAKLQEMMRPLVAESRQFRNIRVQSSESTLLAALGYGQQPASISINDLQRRLNALSNSGEFHDLSAEVNVVGDSALTTVSGKRSPIIDRVELHGLDRLAGMNSVELLRTLAGRPFDRDTIQSRIDGLLRSMRKRGYSLFRVDSVDFKPGARSLEVRMSEGVIRHIRFEGLEQCAEFVVSRELEFSEGDIFRGPEAQAAITRILNTGFFKQAAIETVRDSSGSVEVVVRLKERSTALLRLSANVSSERYTRLGIELAQENLFGYGTQISARFAGGLRDRLAAVDLRSNRIYGTYWTFRTQAYAALKNINAYARTLDPVEGKIERTTLGEYREMRVGERVRFGRQFERLGMLSVEGRYERQGSRNLTAPITDERWHTVSSLKVGTMIDTRDRLPYARSGNVLDFSYETAQHFLGADESFIKILMKAELFAPLGKRHVLHPIVRLGVADATLPLLEQFSLGGQYSMFGMRDDELRGTQLVQASLEYRYQMPFKIYFDTYVSLRYDLGAAWLKPSAIKLGELEHGLGFTIGLDTPLGPADFSLGQSFSFNKPETPRIINVGPIIAYFSFGFPLD